MSWGGGGALDDREPLTGPCLCLEANGDIFNILLQVLLFEYVLHRVYIFMLWFRLCFFWELLLRWLWGRRLLLLLHLSTFLLHSHQKPLDLTVVWTQLDGLVQVL